MSRATYYRAMAEAHRALAKAYALEPGRSAEAINLDVDQEIRIADRYDGWAADDLADSPTHLNTDTPDLTRASGGESADLPPLNVGVTPPQAPRGLL